MNDLSTVILGFIVWQQCKVSIDIFSFETSIQHTGKITFQDFWYVNSAEHDSIAVPIRRCHHLFDYRKAQLRLTLQGTRVEILGVVFLDGGGRL